MGFRLFPHTSTSTPDDYSNAGEQAMEEAVPEVGATSPQVLAQMAAAGSRGAAWRLLYWIMEHDERAITAIRSLDDDRLAQHLLTWIALGTWAGKSFVVPAPLRSSAARQHLRVLFQPGTGIDPARAERVLTAALHDQRAIVRQTATRLLGNLRYIGTLPALLACLHDHDHQVQLQAIKALGRFGDPSVIPEMIALLSLNDEALCNQIFSSLAHLGPPAIPVLIQLQKSALAHIRWHSVRALGRIYDRRALPVLVHALADEDQAVAWMAAKGLVLFGRQGIGPVLCLLLSTPITPWLVDTTSYVLSHQQNGLLIPYVKPVIQHMHEPGFSVGTALAAQKALDHIVADGLGSACGIMPDR